MRLIGILEDEKQAFAFQAFLSKQKIESIYDSYRDAEKKQTFYQIWVVNEEEVDKVLAWYEEFKQNPGDARFRWTKDEPAVSLPPIKEGKRWKIRVEMSRPGISFTLTNFFIFLCIVIFFWNGFQTADLQQKRGELAVEYGTPIEQTLLFDYPQYLANFREFLDIYPVKTAQELSELPPEAQACYKKVENAPTWKGFSELLMARSMHDWKDLPKGTLFGKIRQGEVWRLFTPALLHGSVLHILFNMLWLAILGKQIEARIGKFRLLILILILGVIPNVGQYLISGPNFLGFSGVVIGLAGFIWMREKIAPWEGYPLQRIVLIFLFVYVFAMLVLELVSMSLQFFHVTELSANIANAAHIIGGLVGVALGRFSFFARGKK